VASKQLLIEPEVLLHYGFDSEVALCALASRPPHPTPELRVLEQLSQGSGERASILWWNEQSILACTHDVTTARDVGRHDRAARRAGFQQRLWDTLAVISR
jgi:hypothetical protein